MDTQGQNMCAGRATHPPTSNGGENIACRNKSLIQGVSKTRLFQKQKPLSARGREWGTPYAQATAAPALRSQNRIFLLAFPIHS